MRLFKNGDENDESDRPRAFCIFYHNYRFSDFSKKHSEADARAALQQLDPLWDELFPAEQARIVALLVERVDIGTDGLNVRLRVDGLGGLACEMLAGDMGEAA